MNDTMLHVGKRAIIITNPDKILFPKSGITKLEMVEYYQRIAPVMVPHLKNRPISMQRFPEGIGHEGFFQKDASDYFPSWIKRVEVEKGDTSKVVSHVLCNDAATLVYLASQAVITPHIWLSTVNRLNYPDRIIFDFDPSGKDFSQVCKAAKLFKAFLEELGLAPFVMTTGSRGLHVNIPIKRELLFDDVRQIARDIAAVMVKQYPKLLTLEVRKEKRKGKIFVDYLRNAWAQTAVAPYAMRAREKAPIATPLGWKEVNSSLTPQKYNLSNIFKRISRIGDPWEDIDQYAKSVKRVGKELESLKY